MTLHDPYGRPNRCHDNGLVFQSLDAALKQAAAERGIPLSQLLTETLERQAKVTGFRQMIEETFGPFTEEDREAGRALPPCCARTGDRRRLTSSGFELTLLPPMRS